MSFWNTKDDLSLLRYIHLRKLSLFAVFTLVSDGLKKMYRTLKLLKIDENDIETVFHNCWLIFNFCGGFQWLLGIFKSFFVNANLEFILKKLAVLGSFQSFPYSKLLNHVTPIIKNLR